MASYNSRKIFSIELMDDKKFEVKKYFDITFNEWNLEQYPEKISEAYNLCVGAENYDKYLTYAKWVDITGFYTIIFLKRLNNLKKAHK